jgi:hypothetical protein
MVGATKSIKVLIVAAAAILSLTLPAYPQHFNKGSGGRSGPPVENKPKIDEKAYNAALERIPEPKQKYDPWGVARPSEPAKPDKKSN